MEKEKMAELFVRYLKEQKGFRRFMCEMLEKYRSYAAVKGVICIAHPTEDEAEVLGGLMKQNFLNKPSLKISVTQFKKALDQTPYAGISLEWVVEQYFGGQIKTKSEERLKHEQEKEKFFAEFFQEYEGSFSGSWLAQAKEEKNAGWVYLSRQYRQDTVNLKVALGRAMRAANELPAIFDKTKRIAVFAAEIAGDPHAFDEGRVENQLLTHLILAYLKNKGLQGKMDENKRNAEIKNELFYKAGLLKDDLMNNTMAFGISCITKTGHEHRGIQGFCLEREPFILSLNLIAGLREVKVDSGKVFIVENSGVFAELADRARESRHAFVCTGGQVNLASLMLLDLLAKQGCAMYYAGDFDPEGLQIAQKLKERYPDILRLWRYTLPDYDCCLSEVKLTQEQLQKLRSIREPGLLQVGMRIRETGRAGYQEYLVDRYIEDIGVDC